MANKLTVKQKKFVSEIVKGSKSQAKAYVDAGYSATTDNVARVEGSKLMKKPSIQMAIDKALEKTGATPEFAVQVLADVAEQTEEIGARRLAAKDILELHGWRKDTRPQTTLQINNSFFTESMASKQVDSEVVDV